MNDQFQWFTVTGDSRGWNTQAHSSEESARAVANTHALSGGESYVVSTVAIYHRPQTAVCVEFWQPCK